MLQWSNGVQEERAGTQEGRTRSQQGKKSGAFQGRQTRALQGSNGAQEGTDSLAAGKDVRGASGKADQVAAKK